MSCEAVGLALQDEIDLFDGLLELGFRGAGGGLIGIELQDQPMEGDDFHRQRSWYKSTAPRRAPMTVQMVSFIS